MNDNSELMELLREHAEYVDQTVANMEALYIGIERDRTSGALADDTQHIASALVALASGQRVAIKMIRDLLEYTLTRDGEAGQ